jgi:hypothetical protein
MRDIFYSVTRDDFSSEDEFDHVASFQPPPSNSDIYDFDDYGSIEMNFDVTQSKIVDKLEK